MSERPAKGSTRSTPARWSLPSTSSTARSESCRRGNPRASRVHAHARKRLARIGDFARADALLTEAIAAAAAGGEKRSELRGGGSERASWRLQTDPRTEVEARELRKRRSLSWPSSGMNAGWQRPGTCARTSRTRGRRPPTRSRQRYCTPVRRATGARGRPRVVARGLLPPRSHPGRVRDLALRGAAARCGRRQNRRGRHARDARRPLRDAGTLRRRARLLRPRLGNSGGHRHGAASGDSADDLGEIELLAGDPIAAERELRWGYSGSSRWASAGICRQRSPRSSARRSTGSAGSTRRNASSSCRRAHIHLRRQRRGAFAIPSRQAARAARRVRGCRSMRTRGGRAGRARRSNERARRRAPRSRPDPAARRSRGRSGRGRAACAREVRDEAERRISGGSARVAGPALCRTGEAVSDPGCHAEGRGFESHHPLREAPATGLLSCAERVRFANEFGSTKRLLTRQRRRRARANAPGTPSNHVRASSASTTVQNVPPSQWLRRFVTAIATAAMPKPRSRTPLRAHAQRAVRFVARSSASAHKYGALAIATAAPTGGTGASTRHPGVVLLLVFAPFCGYVASSSWFGRGPAACALQQHRPLTRLP